MTARRVLLLVCFALASGGEIATNAMQSASLTGRVLSGADQPVRRAIVTLNGGTLANGRSAVTDDEGRFTFTDLPAGDFTLSATRPGFLKATYGASRPARPGTPITLKAGAAIKDISLSMIHGSAVGGTLRDPAGDIAPGYRVQAIRLRHTSGGDVGEEAGQAITDDRGEFRIYGLQAGDYVLVSTPRAIIGGLGDIGAPREAEVDAKLAALRTRSNAPTPAAPDPSRTTPPASPPRGVATPATYYPGVVQSAEAVPITLGANDNREALDFTMQLSRAAAIDGVVIPARGVAMPRVQIEIRGDGPQLPVFGGNMGREPSVAQRTSDHSFHISNVPPGHYRVIARSFGTPGTSTQVMSSGGVLPQAPAAGPALWAAVDVDVTGDDIGGISLALQPAPGVAGKILFDTAGAAPRGDAAAVRVALEPVPATDPRSNGLSLPLTVAAGADGSFEFPSVVPGVYRVKASLAGGWWPRSAMANDQDVLDSELIVGANGIHGLTVTMSDRHPSIGGTIVVGGDQPVSTLYLVAFSTDRAKWRAPTRRVASARPSTGGTYTIQDLPPGQYFVAALTDLDATDLEDAAFLEALIPAAATVTVTEGRRTTQDLKIGG